MTLNCHWNVAQSIDGCRVGILLESLSVYHSMSCGESVEFELYADLD